MFKLTPYSIKGGFPFSHSLEQLKAHNPVASSNDSTSYVHFSMIITQMYNPEIRISPKIFYTD